MAGRDISGSVSGAKGCVNGLEAANQVLEVLAERPVTLDRPDDRGQPFGKGWHPSGGGRCDSAAAW